MSIDASAPNSSSPISNIPSVDLPDFEEFAELNNPSPTDGEVQPTQETSAGGPLAAWGNAMLQKMGDAIKVLDTPHRNALKRIGLVLVPVAGIALAAGVAKYVGPRIVGDEHEGFRTSYVQEQATTSKSLENLTGYTAGRLLVDQLNGAIQSAVARQGDEEFRRGAQRAKELLLSEIIRAGDSAPDLQAAVAVELLRGRYEMRDFDGTLNFLRVLRAVKGSYVTYERVAGNGERLEFRVSSDARLAAEVLPALEFLLQESMRRGYRLTPEHLTFLIEKEGNVVASRKQGLPEKKLDAGTIAATLARAQAASVALEPEEWGSYADGFREAMQAANNVLQRFSRETVLQIAKAQTARPRRAL